MTTRYVSEGFWSISKGCKVYVYEKRLLAVFDDNDAAEEYVNWLNSGSKMDKEDRND